MANERIVNIQDIFLNYIRKHKTPLTIFLINGVKLQGVLAWFDQSTLLLKRDGYFQLVYKHAISTLMPQGHIAVFDVKPGGEDMPDRFE